MTHWINTRKLGLLNLDKYDQIGMDEINNSQGDLIYLITFIKNKEVKESMKFISKANQMAAYAVINNTLSAGASSFFEYDDKNGEED